MSSIASYLRNNKDKIIFILVLAFFMVIVWFATKTSNYTLIALPVVAIFAYLAFTNFRWFWYVAIFALPLSMTSHDLLGSIGLTIPTDLFALILTGLIIFKMVSERKMVFDFLGHPIPVIMFVYLLWMFFTAVTSTIPTVSFKWFAQMVWMLIAFFFLPTLFFKKTHTIFRSIQLLSLGFILSLGTIFMLYIATGRNPFGLRFNPGPFFLDHTVFGAFCGMWLPLLVLVAVWGDFKRREKIIAWAAVLFFLVGLFFSYSRGAWGSTLAALLMMGVYGSMKWARRFFVPGLILVFTASGLFYYNSAMSSRSAAKDAVSRKNLSDHIASVTNFKTDYSNAERINRWYCAIEMFKEEPYSGFGPGTYAMMYGRFQISEYMTPVSTRRGDNGTAHNEFLLALSEMGLPGFLLTILLFGIPVWRGLRGFNLALRKNTKLLYLGVTFAIMSYNIHALVNNFLDQDKIGATYFVFLAVIVALDAYVLPREYEEEGKGLLPNSKTNS